MLGEARRREILPRSLHCAARRAKRRREGKSRAAPVGMTILGSLDEGRTKDAEVRGEKGNPRAKSRVTMPQYAPRSLRYAARRATMRRERKNRAASVGMTIFQSRGKDCGLAAEATTAKAAASRRTPRGRSWFGRLGLGNIGEEGLVRDTADGMIWAFLRFGAHQRRAPRGCGRAIGVLRD